MGKVELGCVTHEHVVSVTLGERHASPARVLGRLTAPIAVVLLVVFNITAEKDSSLECIVKTNSDDITKSVTTGVGFGSHPRASTMSPVICCSRYLAPTNSSLGPIPLSCNATVLNSLTGQNGAVRKPAPNPPLGLSMASWLSDQSTSPKHHHRRFRKHESHGSKTTCNELWSQR